MVGAGSMDVIVSAMQTSATKKAGQTRVIEPKFKHPLNPKSQILNPKS